MLRRKSSAFLLMVVLITGSLLLQGFSLVPGFLKDILNKLLGKTIKDAVGQSLSAAVNISEMYGMKDVTRTLDRVEPMVKVLPGFQKGIQLTVERAETIFDGEGEITAGELDNQGAFFDTAEDAAKSVGTVVEKLNDTTDRFYNFDKIKRVRRTMKRIKEASEDIDKEIDEIKKIYEKGKTLWNKFERWLDNKEGGDDLKIPSIMTT